MNPPSSPRTGLWSSFAVGTAVWVVCLLRLALAHPDMAATAAGSAFYAAVLASLAIGLVRVPVPNDRLRVTSAGAVRTRWFILAGVLVAWGLLYAIAYGGVLPAGIRVPYLTPLIADWLRWQPIRGVNGPTLLSFLSLGLVPAIVLLALGARPRELGLVWPIPGTGLASLACLTLPALFVVWAMAHGKITWTVLGIMLLHNFLSNSFPEEVQCRGVFLAPLRAVVPCSWALLLQGLLFGLFHVGGAIAEEGGDYGLALAAALALNFPMGVGLGIVAVRTGSLVLPIAIHISLHIMKDVLR